jgi:hypothetical protein
MAWNNAFTQALSKTGVFVVIIVCILHNGFVEKIGFEIALKV